MYYDSSNQQSRPLGSQNMSITTHIVCIHEKTVFYITVIHIIMFFYSFNIALDIYSKYILALKIEIYFEELRYRREEESAAYRVSVGKYS